MVRRAVSLLLVLAAGCSMKASGGCSSHNCAGCCKGEVCFGGSEDTACGSGGGACGDCTKA
jgi:hypothetical protein